MFYGPVGGAPCLLKWCFNGPNETMALTHTHTHNTQSLWKREGRLEERREGRSKGEDMKKYGCAVPHTCCNWQTSATTAR